MLVLLCVAVQTSRGNSKGHHGCPINAHELEQRATWPDFRVSQYATSPPIYHLHGLLSAAEVEALVGLAVDGMKTHQEPRGKFHATVSLDKATALNATDAVQHLNRRLAALSGLPETHIEEGYFSIYNSGYKMESLHLDNHHVLMEPRRVLSFVIYLHSEDKLAGTVFPFAQTDDGLSVLGGEQMQDEHINSWNSRIAREGFVMGDAPQRGRICAANQAECIGMLNTAHKACQTGQALALKPGDAVMFYQHDEAVETVRAFHAGCGMQPVQPGGTNMAKVVLAKFVRAGPRWEFRREHDFTDALNAHRAKIGKKPMKYG